MGQDASLGNISLINNYIIEWLQFGYDFLQGIELLCEKVISSANEQLSPCDAFRHIMEALSAGLILPTGSGLIDPCEKNQTDVFKSLSNQDRIDITSLAQVGLLLNCIHFNCSIVFCQS